MIQLHNASLFILLGTIIISFLANEKEELLEKVPKLPWSHGYKVTALDSNSGYLAMESGDMQSSIPDASTNMKSSVLAEFCLSDFIF